MAAPTGTSGTSAASTTAPSCPTLKFNKFWPVSWARDSSGVYYSRYPLKPGENAEQAQRGDDTGRPDVYFHNLGDAQSADKLVFQVTDHPDARASRRWSPMTAAIC